MIVTLIIAALTGIPALICFIIAHRQHKQMGAPWTNKWFYASLEEREEMTDEEKAVQYKLSRNIFFGCGVVFVIACAQILSGLQWLWTVFGVVSLGLCVYGIAASMKK